VKNYAIDWNHSDEAGFRTLEQGNNRKELERSLRFYLEAHRQQGARIRELRTNGRLDGFAALYPTHRVKLILVDNRLDWVR